MIVETLSNAKLVTIVGGGSGESGAADATASNISTVIQTVLAAQLVSNVGLLQDNGRKTNAVVTRK